MQEEQCHLAMYGEERQQRAYKVFTACACVGENVAHAIYSGYIYRVAYRGEAGCTGIPHRIRSILLQ